MLTEYSIVGLIFLALLAVTLVILVAAHTIGPKRGGFRKGQPYESGVPVIHGVERRFNIRFYIVAMLFLLFDVEIVFLWPWALAFHRACVTGEPIAVEGGLSVDKAFLGAGMGIFLAILVLGLIYEWKKGAFRWD